METVCDLFALCAINIHKRVKRQGDVAMLPILPLKAVCLPGEELCIEITEVRYQKLLERCMKNTAELAIVLCSDYKDELGTLHNVGCLAKITHFDVWASGIVEIKVKGIQRFKFTRTEPKLEIHYASDVCFLDEVVDVQEDAGLLREVLDTYAVYIQKLRSFDKDYVPEDLLQEVCLYSSFKLLNDISMPWEKKQQGLEINSIKKRFEHILSCLQCEVDMLNFLTEKNSQERGSFEGTQILN